MSRVLSCAPGGERAANMSEITILDVSQYARLWRGVWWTQHFVTLIALVAGSILLGISALYLTGGLEALANASIRDVMGQGLDPAKQEDALLNIAAYYWMARSVVRDTPAAVASIVVASAVIIISYALGCRMFRLRLLTMHLIALLTLTVIFGVALAQLARAGVATPEYDPEGGRVQKFAEQLLTVIWVVVLMPSLVLLLVQGLLAWRLWRHRLRPEFAPTHQMTRSLGHNLATWHIRMPSSAGAAIHLGLLGVLGALVWWFSAWVGQTLAYGPIFLLAVLIWLIFFPLLLLYRASMGEAVLRDDDFAAVVPVSYQAGRLVIIAIVLVAARAIWRLGTRFNLRRRDAIILKDKPPVLLLRSFADDVAGITPSALIPRLLWRRKRLEETIGKELAQAGPFIAIGKPGETLPQIGAQRLYVADTEWQEVVRSYIARAEPIILIAGKTTWVQWELANIVATARTGHLLIVFPRTSEPERAARWQNLKPALANTPWSAAADAIDIAGALAVIARSKGFVVIRSRAARESDYEAALRIATFLMGQGDPSFRSRS
jgi:hypothetical protein